MKILKIVRKEETEEVCFLEVTFSKYVLFKGLREVVRDVYCKKSSSGYYFMPEFCTSGNSLMISNYSLVQSFAKSGLTVKRFK